MQETTYGVTGATGHLGRLVIDELLQKVRPEQIVAIVRDGDKAKDLQSKGVTVREADYQDTEALTNALSDVQKLLLISSNNLVSGRFEHHRNVIDAAKAAGVSYVAYTSILRADTTTNPLAPDHKATEEYLGASGLEYTLLRHGWYTENYIETAETAELSGVVLTSAGNGKVSSASRADYAAGDVAVLTRDNSNEDRRQIYELAGDNAWDFAELVATITSLHYKEVRLQSVSYEDHVKTLTGFGVDAATAQFVAAIDASIARGDLEDNSGQLSALIGRPTTPLKEGLSK